MTCWIRRVVEVFGALVALYGGYRLIGVDVISSNWASLVMSYSLIMAVGLLIVFSAHNYKQVWTWVLLVATILQDKITRTRD